jgi:transposase
MVRRWMSETQRADKTPAPPAFVPVNRPAATSVPGNQSVSDKRRTIRIEIPRAGGSVLVEWPAEQAHQCVALLRDLLG